MFFTTSLTDFFFCFHRKIYYFLYRIFNNYYISKNNLIESNLKKHLHDLFFRVLEDIKYTSDSEKMAMFNIVSNWTSCNREKSVKVYGGKSITKIKTEPEEVSDCYTNYFLFFDFPLAYSSSCTRILLIFVFLFDEECSGLLLRPHIFTVGQILYGRL